jgi:hypothetical protein
VTQGTAPGAAGYRVAVPEDWWSVDLRSATLEQQVERLVARQWRGVDNAPHLRDQAAKQLLRTARDGAENGADRLALSLGRPGELPLAASLLLTPLQLGVDVPTREVLGELGITYAADAAAVSTVELPAGPAVRAVWLAEPDSVSGAVAPVVCLDIALAAGDGTGLLLSFRSQLAPLADQLVELFDAVASTVRFVPPRAA